MLHLGKRIDPTPPASANLAHDPAGLQFRVRGGEDFRRGSGLDGPRSLRRDQVRTGRTAEGRLIRHAGAPTLAIGALAIAMVEAPFGTLLMAAVGFTALSAAGFLAATEAAITLATIAVRAEIEHRPTGRKVTNSLAKNRGTSGRHRFREAAVDNRRRSWQDDSR
jgi:hypothetical protein